MAQDWLGIPRGKELKIAPQTSQTSCSALPAYTAPMRELFRVSYTLPCSAPESGSRHPSPACNRIQGSPQEGLWKEEHLTGCPRPSVTSHACTNTLCQESYQISWQSLCFPAKETKNKAKAITWYTGHVGLMLWSGEGNVPPPQTWFSPIDSHGPTLQAHGLLF